MIARVIETADELTRYQGCFPDFQIVTIRLTASTATLTARVTRREVGSERDWHVQRAIELSGLLNVGDFEIDTSSANVVQTAEKVIALTGLG